jgi:membrane protease YdiL (CAAX protease family)
MRLVWQLLAVIAAAFIGGQVVATVQGNPWLTLALGVLTSVLAVLLYRWVVRRTEHRPVTEAAGKGAGSAIVRGALLGVALFAAVILNIFFLGYYKVDGPGSLMPAVGLSGFMAAAAVTEELLFRGVLFRIIEERLGTWISMALTAVLFGLWHSLNPDASVWGAVAIMLEAGGLLAAAYAATRSLWLPIGLHFGWNFAASAVFGTVVSGNGTNQGLLDASMSGPTLVTGGDFGPEGSLYSVLFCVLATIGFVWLARRRGRIVPLRRRAAATTLSR